MEDDDDDIGDLDDYLIPNDASYYVDEEDERFKERKRKLIGIPYEKPPTFKSEKIQYGVSTTMDTAYRSSVPVGPVFLLRLLALAIVAAPLCLHLVFQSLEMPSVISCWMAAKVMADVSDVDILLGGILST
ncbi:hypothetical protein Tco_1130554 [Tanacetum coccineum]